MSHGVAGVVMMNQVGWVVARWSPTPLGGRHRLVTVSLFPHQPAQRLPSDSHQPLIGKFI